MNIATLSVKVTQRSREYPKTCAKTSIELTAMKLKLSKIKESGWSLFYHDTGWFKPNQLSINVGSNHKGIFNKGQVQAELSADIRGGIIWMIRFGVSIDKATDFLLCCVASCCHVNTAADALFYQFHYVCLWILSDLGNYLPCTLVDPAFKSFLFDFCLILILICFL